MTEQELRGFEFVCDSDSSITDAMRLSMDAADALWLLRVLADQLGPHNKQPVTVWLRGWLRVKEPGEED